MVTSQSGQTIPVKNSNRESGESFANPQYKLELELLRIFDNIDPNTWVPEGAYGEGHQAAIESALSTVLTVSTLAGCRAGGFVQEHCCLHHAVQVSF